MAQYSPHFEKTLETWEHLQQRRSSHAPIVLDGENLHIADVVAAASHGCIPELTSSPEVRRRLQESVDILMQHLSDGYYVYGVNTGFGGSADSRTDEVVSLQASLMQLTQAGILGRAGDTVTSEHAMPAPWVRATMTVRCNATIRGHSAVSQPILEAVLNLLRRGLTPLIPLRGSVSASGDLMPLSYVAGTIEGSPDIYVQLDDGRVVPANQALEMAGVKPMVLGPKEGLGLINGTSASAALGALVMHEANQLALLTQALTGISVEALQGSSESFRPFIAAVRPHPGQIECARNILSFLQGSHLSRDVQAPKDRRRDDLVQDRYCTRTAPQWIGPQLEDLLLAERQVSIELNSSSDNPLVDLSTADILYGGNFQAASITSAMEKARLALQMFGRMLFCQVTELIDPSLSGGLPANLAADDPSLSFTMKGVDISMASYMAELSYLANPMSSHVQAAEMHNQSVNSMAFASARMSMQAVEILSMMCACSLYAGCQALDLRAMHLAFVQKASAAVAAVNERFCPASLTAEQVALLNDDLDLHFQKSWKTTAKMDLLDRCEALATSSIPVVVARFSGSAADILRWKSEAFEAISSAWTEVSQAFTEKQDTVELLGRGSKALYSFVRNELGVPFHLGRIEHPTLKCGELRGRPKKTVGGWISVIHDAIKTGHLYEPLMKLAKHDLTNGSMTNGTNGNGTNGNGTNGTNGTH